MEANSLVDGSNFHYGSKIFKQHIENKKQILIIMEIIFASEANLYGDQER